MGCRWWRREGVDLSSLPVRYFDGDDWEAAAQVFRMRPGLRFEVSPRSRWGHGSLQGSPMKPNHSIQFFDTQFQQQALAGDRALNPFELAAIAHLRGRVLDYGCGMGNLAFAAAERGCSVLALDASPAAISHIQRRAAAEALAVQGAVADLRDYELDEDFDAVVSIGLLMFFDCPTALRTLSMLQARVREGGVAIVNVLVEGTTYLDMFDAEGRCLFPRAELEARFAGWSILHAGFSDFEAPGGKNKSFATVIARKPGARHVAAL
jgi:tellurite methyltransferase